MHSERSAYLSAVDELHGGLAEEEVHMVLVLQGVDKVRGCRRETNLLSTPSRNSFGRLTVEVLVIVLLCPELASVDEGVGRGEIGHCARVQFAAWSGMGILMKM